VVVLERLWTKPFILLTVSMLLLYTGFYSMLPVLPVHLKNIGAQQWQIGIIVGLFTLSAVICRPFVGKWLDRYGRKLYIYGGIIFFSLFSLSYSFVSVLAVVVGIRMLHGVSWGIGNTALGTAITDHIPRKKLGQGMGWYGLSMTLAMALGPLLGNYMMGQYSAMIAFVGASIVTTVPLLLIYQLHIDGKLRVDGALSFGKRKLAPIQWSRQLWMNLIVISCLAFSFGGITTYVPLYLGQQLSNVTIFFLMYALSLSICRPLVGKWIDRKGEKLIIIVSLAFVMVALVLLSAASGVSGIIGSAVLYGLGFGMGQPALQVAIMRLVSVERSGGANAIFFTAFDIGIGSGAIILGFCANQWSYSSLFVISSAVVMLGLIVYLASSGKGKVRGKSII